MDRYSRLDPVIHKISSELAPSASEKKRRNKQLKQILGDYLLPFMKEEDELFRNLFTKINYSGSYYENLRIRDANEFDLNLELSSHVRNIKIHRETSGPAVTLTVEYNFGEVFSVDLVPVFVFDGKEWPGLPVRQRVVRNSSYANVWSVVPKAPSLDIQNVGRFWRMSFYNQEKQILNDKSHLKHTVKLIKMLRDKQGWHCLSSYYIKTVSLWINMKNNPQYWNASIGILFIQMLTALKDHVKSEKSIPFFWDERHNLMSSVNIAEFENVGNRIEHILKYIDDNLVRNPNSIGIVFGVN